MQPAPRGYVIPGITMARGAESLPPRVPPFLDSGCDGRPDLDGAADRAQPVMRLLHRVRQQRPGRIALLAGGEPDPERHLYVGQAVAARVAYLLRVDQHLEGLGFRPA